MAIPFIVSENFLGQSCHSQESTVITHIICCHLKNLGQKKITNKQKEDASFVLFLKYPSSVQQTQYSESVQSDNILPMRVHGYSN